MEPKKSKYDTNPLDPDYVRQSDELWGEDDEHNTQEVKGATRPVGRDEPRANPYSEAPTRSFDAPPLDTPYQSVFAHQTYAPPPAKYNQQTAYQAPIPTAPPTSRVIPGIGLPENWSVMLPYAPFYIGVVVALIELFLVPRKETRVRFHASQGLALHITILAIQTIFGIVGAITDSSIGGTLFKAAATVFLIISMVRVWKGEPHRISPLAEPSQWFNEHIEPRKQS